MGDLSAVGEPVTGATGDGAGASRGATNTGADFVEKMMVSRGTVTVVVVTGGTVCCGALGGFAAGAVVGGIAPISFGDALFRNVPGFKFWALI